MTLLGFQTHACSHDADPAIPFIHKSSAVIFRDVSLVGGFTSPIRRGSDLQKHGGSGFKGLLEFTSGVYLDLPNPTFL